MQKTKFEKKAAKRAAKKAAKEVQKAQADMESFLPGFLFGDSLSIDAYQAEIERLRALKAMLSKEEEDATASST
ncbi:hypothetical protein N7493_008192 [Penicillium malachiteum]|uniref:Uncharacterized protein n=1 Tax=Penicillium malachiteum TaxID=1324776 RepID=A0AAD6HGP8_9EURO|nr:hypothetical protein N7493_008192 [Penicillium malachiteum]